MSTPMLVNRILDLKRKRVAWMLTHNGDQPTMGTIELEEAKLEAAFRRVTINAT